MGLINFMKNAGVKIFGKSEEKKEAEKAQLILEHINKYNFKVQNLKVEYDDEAVTVYGEAENVEEKNRILVTAGNVDGVEKVNDKMTVKVAEPQLVAEEKQFYTVKPGDTLSKISKEVYGDANKYNVIFNANTPMLKTPDLIYPGQVLVIPKLS